MVTAICSVTVVSGDAKPTEQKTKPRKLGIKTFTFIVFIMLITVRVGQMYLNGCVRMLEKQFGFQSTQTGFFSAADNISAIPMVLVLGFLGDRVNKARILAFCGIITAVSNLVASLPYFTSKKHEIKTNNTNFSTDILCNSAPKFCDEAIILGHTDSNKVAFVIIIISRLLHGVGAVSISNLAIAYISSNTETNNRGSLMGWVTVTLFFGTVIGVQLSGAFNKLPLNLKESDIDASDPRFIGAWWLGFLVVGGLLFLCSLPLFLFPSNLKSSPNNATQPAPETKRTTITADKGFKYKVKELYQATKLLLTCASFMVFTIVFVFLSMSGTTYGTNMLRYVEVHYRLPIYLTNIVFGGLMTLGGILGGLLGGYISSKLQLQVHGLVKFLTVSTLLAVAANVAALFFGCPQLNFAGATTSSGSSISRLNVSSLCSAQCGCDMAASQPVCGADGLDYFSPCHAGCTTRNGTTEVATFIGCGCVHGGTASPGSCPMSCPYFIPFAVFIFFITSAAATGYVPMYLLLLKIVPQNLESYALGIFSFLKNITVSLPVPVIVGLLVDKCCMIWQQQCEHKGSCLLYDVTGLRFTIFGVSLVALLAACVFFIIGWFLIRCKEYPKNKEENCMNEAPREYEEID